MPRHPRRMSTYSRWRRSSLAVLLLAASVASSNELSSQGTVSARPSDVSSLDAIMAALYDVISGPAGQARDWDRFRSLFIPGARLIPASGPAGQPVQAMVWTPDDFVERAGRNLERSGFFEREIGRTTESFGSVTHAFSAYDSRRTATDSAPFASGINSVQLLNDGTRWWVVTVYWDSSPRTDLVIPERYLRRP